MSEQETTNGNGGQIYGAMAAILQDVEAIGKGRRNEQQNYAFRGIDDIYNMVHPLLSKHQVFCVPRMLGQDTSERVTANGTTLRFVQLSMAYDFFAPDGSHVTAEVVGEAMDAGDKASNKAMSAAHKYVLLQTFCIPTGDIPDADQTTHENLQPHSRRAASQAAPDVPPCPDCRGPMWDNRATKKGRQPDFKCKDKECNKAVWLDSAPQGLTTKEAAIQALMSQAEKLLPPDSKKLAELRGISDPDELGQKVQILLDLKKEKEARVNGDDRAEQERIALIEQIEKNISASEISGELKRSFGGKSLYELNHDQLVQLQDNCIPF